MKTCYDFMPLSHASAPDKHEDDYSDLNWTHGLRGHQLDVRKRRFPDRHVPLAKRPVEKSYDERVVRLIPLIISS